MLALKLTLVPLFLSIVSMSGKWWGPAVAGWLAGLPVVAGPILFLLTLQHGAAFGARAAVLSLAAVLASEAFNFAYAWSCRRCGWPLAWAAGFATWLGAASLLARLPATPVAATLVALAATAFGQACLPRADAAAAGAGAPLTRADLAGRAGAGAALTWAVTSLSGALGPTWSGLLAVFPLLGSVLCVSSHRAHGPAFVIHMLRGMVLGRFSFVAFCLAVVTLLPLASAGVAFGAAAALSIVVQAVTRRVATLRAGRGDFVDSSAAALSAAASSAAASSAAASSAAASSTAASSAAASSTAASSTAASSTAASSTAASSTAASSTAASSTAASSTAASSAAASSAAASSAAASSAAASSAAASSAATSSTAASSTAASSTAASPAVASSAVASSAIARSATAAPATD
jgi:hypothetical protein